MKIKLNDAALVAVKELLDTQTENMKNLRIDISGVGWGGVELSLGVDEQKVDDKLVVVDGINFVIEKDIAEMIGDVIVEHDGNALTAQTVA